MFILPGFAKISLHYVCYNICQENGLANSWLWNLIVLLILNKKLQVKVFDKTFQ